MSEVTPEGLKIQALLERVSSLTAEYENKVADLRVELTVVSRELESLRKQGAVLEENGADVSEEVTETK